MMFIVFLSDCDVLRCYVLRLQSISCTATMMLKIQFIIHMYCDCTYLILTLTLLFIHLQMFREFPTREDVSFKTYAIRYIKALYLIITYIQHQIHIILIILI